GVATEDRRAGKGGNGGHGGGGGGGPSIGVVCRGSTSVSGLVGTSISTAGGGSGGSSPGDRGDNGVRTNSDGC
ncbi:MAG: hypothetical protein EA397_10435, partial [Deltaproteobacteria bacterium]